LVQRRQRTFTHQNHVRPLREAEREYIPAAFEPNDGNRTLTAQQLEVGHATRFRTRGATAGGVVPALRGRSSGAASSSSDPLTVAAGSPAPMHVVSARSMIVVSN